VLGDLSEYLTPKKIKERVKAEVGGNRRKMRGDQKV
jgi:hypothetical protein